MNIARTRRLISWATLTFGNIALTRHERAMRFLEEAAELAQACEVGPGEAQAILQRVWERPPGHPPREFGQALSTLELLALVCNCDMEHEADEEEKRIHSIPQEEWDRRHAAKVTAGTATASNRGLRGASAEARRDGEHVRRAFRHMLDDL